MADRIVIPSGIKKLRRITRQLNRNNHEGSGKLWHKPRFIRCDTFEEIVITLQICADNNGGCKYCPYCQPCIKDFEFLCGRVGQAKEKRNTNNYYTNGEKVPKELPF